MTTTTATAVLNGARFRVLSTVAGGHHRAGLRWGGAPPIGQPLTDDYWTHFVVDESLDKPDVTTDPRRLDRASAEAVIGDPRLRVEVVVAPEGAGQ